MTQAHRSGVSPPQVNQNIFINKSFEEVQIEFNCSKMNFESSELDTQQKSPIGVVLSIKICH
jgi:hypothetical protein